MLRKTAKTILAAALVLGATLIAPSVASAFTGYGPSMGEFQHICYISDPNGDISFDRFGDWNFAYDDSCSVAVTNHRIYSCMQGSANYTGPWINVFCTQTFRPNNGNNQEVGGGAAGGGLQLGYYYRQKTHAGMAYKGVQYSKDDYGPVNLCC